MTKKEITKDEINELPIVKFSGNIHLITEQEAYLKAIDKLKNETHLGFDTETRPSFKKGEKNNVCLLQLSTLDDAYLFRLNKYPLGDKLKELLANKNIIKTGVAVRDDIKGLRKINDFEPGSFIELADLAKQLEIKQLGLRSLAAIVLNIRISKQFKLTNWEQPNLNKDQLCYAATDAWIGLKLHTKMTELLTLQRQ